jgi:hypothetical protein
MKLAELKQLNEVTFAKLKPGESGLAISDNQIGQALVGYIDKTKFDYDAEPLVVMSFGDTLNPPKKGMYSVWTLPKPGAPGKPQYSLVLKNKNNQVIDIRGSKSKVEGAFVHSSESKTANKGEIAEGLLGAALFAKLKQRKGDIIGAITANDLWAVIDQLKQTGEDEYSVSLPDADGKLVKDSIRFTLKLKAAPYKDIMNIEKRPLIGDLVNSAVAYANGRDVQRYSQHFFKNGRPDVIHVVSDGVSGEESRKTDVELLVSDPKNPGQMRSTRINISLKTGGIGQFGQVGGSEFENVAAFFDKFGIDLNSIKDEFDAVDLKQGREAAVAYAYEGSAETINDLLSGDYDDEEYLYLRDLAKTISYFTTLNNPQVIMVDFSKGGYKMFRFDRVEELLKSVDLTSKFISDKARPEIIIYDKNNPKDVLLRLRAKIENKPEGIYIRNIVEKGPLFEKIFAVTFK